MEYPPLLFSVEDVLASDEEDGELVVDGSAWELVVGGRLDDVVGVEDVVGVVVEVGVLVVVGSSVVEVVGAEVVGSAAEVVLESPPDPSKKDTTMLAFAPFGTVTTQKSEPPAPEALLSLSTPSPETLQGRPLQSLSGHSISRPKSGFVLESADSSHMGFSPSLTNVDPSAIAFAPATYGAQLPIGSLSSPHTHPLSEPTPGGLM